MRQKACRLSHLEDSIIEEKKIDKLVRANNKLEKKLKMMPIRVNHNTQILVPKGADIEKAIENYRKKHDK